MGKALFVRITKAERIIMKVKELIEILQDADENLNVKITDFEGNIDEDIEVIDHDGETVYLVTEVL